MLKRRCTAELSPASTLKDWSSNSKKILLTLQPINVMLNYKILPYDHLKVLRTNRKTTRWALVPLCRRLQCFSSTGLLIVALLSKLPWTAHPTWSNTWSLDSFSSIIPVDNICPGKSFFLVFTTQTMSQAELYEEMSESKVKSIANLLL